MKALKSLLAPVMLCLAAQTFAQQTKSLPTIPVGLDAYRMWDKWPMLRIGDRAYMRSTYDREGANQSADASHYLFAGDEDHNVALDVKGRGVMYFFRANHWHGSPWHFIADGKDNSVEESATADRMNAISRFKTSTVFIPGAAFPKPLNFTWADTKGADLIWTPMPFKDAFSIAYSKTHYGTGYFIYHLYANPQNLSQPINSWDINQAPDKDVLDLIEKAGTDIAPKNIKKITGDVKLNNDKVLIANVKAAASSVRAFKLTLPLDKADELEHLRLQVTWDGTAQPSIDAPLALFFGAGTLYNRDSREYLVKGFPINIRFDYPNKKIELACYYPMPFFKSARFELADITPGDTQINYEIRYEPLKTAPNLNAYFHATCQDIPHPEPGKDMTYLDTRGIEGHDDWSGSFVGTSFVFSHNANLGTLEGDPRFFFDDSDSPQAYGTGTEEWAGGGDYWGGQNMTLAFAGHPLGAQTKAVAKSDKDLIESAYRFLLADMMPFGKRALIKLEHGGENLSTEHYESVAYWYGLPAASLIKTDDIDVGNTASESSHNYTSPQASPVEKIVSRYELGISQFPNTKQMGDLAGKDVYPAHGEDGRFTRGNSEFTVKLAANNQGALLRRTLDYSFPNQTAEVYIADANNKIADWKLAGTWYLAGSNTCIYSDPPGELDNRLLRTKTSYRRFRDDEFLIPMNLTVGKSAIRIKVKFVPNNQELFPGFPFPKQSAWSELRYSVYSYVLPDFRLKK